MSQEGTHQLGASQAGTDKSGALLGAPRSTARPLTFKGRVHKRLWAAQFRHSAQLGRGDEG